MSGSDIGIEEGEMVISERWMERGSKKEIQNAKSEYLSYRVEYWGGMVGLELCRREVYDRNLIEHAGSIHLRWSGR